MSIVRSLGAIVLLLGLVGCSAPTPAAPQAPTAAPAAAANPTAAAGNAAGPGTKLKAAYTAISATQSPLWVALESGVFPKYGLDVEAPYIATSTTLTAAMLSGEVNIAVAAEEAVVSADLNGADLVMLAGGTNRLVFSVYAKPDIQSVQDLKGKRLGVTRTGSSTDFGARYLLTHNNLEPSKDVTIVQMGGVPEILTGIQAGALDAGVISPPTTFKAADAGLREVIDLSKSDLTFYQSPVIARRSWVQANRDAATRFLKGYLEGIAIMKKQPDKGQAIIGKYSNTTDPKILSSTLTQVLPLFPRDQTPEMAAVKTGLDQVALTQPKAVGADPNQFVDVTVMQDIIKSGFLESIGL